MGRFNQFICSRNYMNNAHAPSTDPSVMLDLITLPDGQERVAEGYMGFFTGHHEKIWPCGFGRNVAIRHTRRAVGCCVSTKSRPWLPSLSPFGTPMRVFSIPPRR
jgi:hypothetical protein